MESPPSASILPPATNQNTLASEEDGNGSNSNQTQDRLRFNECGQSTESNSVENQSNVPLSHSDTRSPGCNDMTATLQRRRGEHLEAQLREQLRRHQQPQSEGETTERETVLPATATTMSRKALFVLRPVHRYVDLVCIGLSVLAYLLETTMNAALAIFGIGVGVGLVLGDSFRATLPLLPSVQVPQNQQGTTITNPAAIAAAAATQVGTEIMDPISVPNLLPAQ